MCRAIRGAKRSAYTVGCLRGPTRVARVRCVCLFARALGEASLIAHCATAIGCRLVLGGGYLQSGASCGSLRLSALACYGHLRVPAGTQWLLDTFRIFEDIRVGVSREPRESRERGDAGVALVERQKGSSEGTRPRGRGSIER